MKKRLLIIGIIVILAGVIAVLISALSRYGYYHVLDGSSDLYVRLYRRMYICLASGIVLVTIGTVCIIIRTKI